MASRRAWNPGQYLKQSGKYGYSTFVAQDDALSEFQRGKKAREMAEEMENRRLELEKFINFVETVFKEKFPIIFAGIRDNLFYDWLKYGRKQVPQAAQQIETFLKKYESDEYNVALNVWNSAYTNYRHVKQP